MKLIYNLIGIMEIITNKLFDQFGIRYKSSTIKYSTFNCLNLSFNLINMDFSHEIINLKQFYRNLH